MNKMNYLLLFANQITNALIEKAQLRRDYINGIIFFIVFS